jgi:sugar lactone lactonase YvrE
VKSGRITKVTAFHDPGMVCFNDAIEDSHSRVFAGTIGHNERIGALHRIDPDGGQHLLFRGTEVSNGMGFSPDGRMFYWTCSTKRKIFAFRYTASTGEISDRREFYSIGAEQGLPDGLCVDRAGNIWSAHWEGS